MLNDRPRTLGELKSANYPLKSVKEELRSNLIARIRAGKPLFHDILGYEDTVVPQIQNAILSKHDMLLLGLRGQAKTRILRQMVELLDDAIPIVEGSEVNDHPYAPVSWDAKEKIAKRGDDTPISWIGRAERYHEKLATPDVTIADLVGEIDLVKHAEGRYLSSEQTMHFGLVPRTNRGIFCINELPDLAPKIQVGLFNVLEERDVQIRGYPVRLNLDICLVFSANPEDYTNRGRIVTPLKDRIGSVVRTHYPLTREIGIAINDANAWIDRDQTPRLAIPKFVKEIVEETARQARTNSHVNQASGVSVRMSIASLENVISNAERRALAAGDSVVVPRPSDIWHAIPAARGKLELVMSEDDGHEDVLVGRLIAEAIKTVFTDYFDPKDFRATIEDFDGGRTVELGDNVPAKTILDRIEKIPLLRKRAEELAKGAIEGGPDAELRDAFVASAAEFLLEGLHVHNKLNKNQARGKTSFKR
jgi:magnesium chelatase subunit I